MCEDLEYFEDPLFKNGRIALLEKVVETLILGAKNKSESIMLVNSALVEIQSEINSDDHTPKEWKGGVEEGIEQIQITLKKLKS